MDNCQVSGTYWLVRFVFGQCNWTSLPTRATLHNNTHSFPRYLPLLQCNADFHNHVDDHNALCGVVSASSAWCTRVPAASCLLPGALCRLNGDCCSVALAVALCLKAVHILHNLLDPPLGITFHYSPSLPWRSTTFGRDLSCNLARKGEILVPHKLIPAMPFSRITNRRLAKHTNTHKHVCVLASFMTSYCHVAWQATWQLASLSLLIKLQYFCKYWMKSYFDSDSDLDLRRNMHKFVWGN